MAFVVVRAEIVKVGYDPICGLPTFKAYLEDNEVYSFYADELQASARKLLKKGKKYVLKARANNTEVGVYFDALEILAIVPSYPCEDCDPESVRSAAIFNY